MKSIHFFSPAMPALLLFIFTTLAGPGSAFAQGFALIDLVGKSATFETFRNDGKSTLLLVRYDRCDPCDETELALQQWYAKQDASKVSVLAYNIDDADKYEKVRERLSSNDIQYPNFFSSDPERATADFQQLTGKAIRGVPVLVLINPDGTYAGSNVGSRVDWASIDDYISSLKP